MVRPEGDRNDGHIWHYSGMPKQAALKEMIQISRYGTAMAKQSTNALCVK
jgi:hypothetical protein